MTKKELAESIHEKLGLSKRESGDIVDYFFETVKKTLKKGGSVKLPGFGSLYVKTRKPKKGRNLATKEVVEVPSRDEIVFKPSRILRALTNSETK